VKISLQGYLELKLKRKTAITYENIISRLSETQIKERKLPLHMKISLQGYLKLKLKKKTSITYENVIARLFETQIKEGNFHYI
jgi:hypothetical protein